MEHQPPEPRSVVPLRSPKDKLHVIGGPVWADLVTYRKQRGESQEEFWSHFGVTQSAGSRYEKDARHVPTSVHMLVIALALGVISEADLDRLRVASHNTNEPT